MAKNELKISEINAFLHDFEDATSSWLTSSENSWKEYSNGFTSPTPTKSRTDRRYPLWWATNKVRQPLTFSRVPDIVVRPVLTDVDGFITSVATVCEKLGSALIEYFPFHRTLCQARDDALLTSAGVVRYMLDAEVVQEPKKIYLQEIEVPQLDPQTGQQLIVTQLIGPDGEQIEDPSEIYQDQDGRLYVESEELEERVAKESATLKAIPYNNFVWDHEACDFSEWEYCGFRSQLTTRQIIEKWGTEAYAKLKPRDPEEEQGAKHSRFRHDIVEMWHKPTKKRYIFADGGGDFLSIDDDPYELDGFFPIPYPIFDNLSDQGTVPTPEFTQIEGQLAHINDIFDQMSQCVRAARPRALFDSAIPELQKLISKSRANSFIGIPNLAAKLQQGQTVVQYLDVNPILAALQNLAANFDREIAAYDQITGFSDVVRGVTNPYETATANERKSQFAIHRLVSLQEDMQRFCRDCIRGLIDLALGKFSDERLYEILAPSLDDKERAEYSRIMAVLRRDYKRKLTIDIETGSTVMIDEDTEKAQAMELVQTVGGYLQQMSGILQNQPALGEIMTKLLDHGLRKMRGGQAFVDDVSKTIEALQQQLQVQQQQPPQPDVEMMKVQLKQQELALKQQAEAQQLQLKAQSEASKQELARYEIQMKAMELSSDNQVEQYKLSLEQLNHQLRAQEHQTSAQIAQLEIMLKQQSVDDKRTSEEEKLALETYKTQLKAQEVMLSEREKLIEEQRLSMQTLHEAARIELEQIQKNIDIADRINRPEQPIHVNVSLPKAGKKTGKIIRDEMGNASVVIDEESDGIE